MPHIDEGRLEAWLDRPRSGLTAVEVAEVQRHLDGCAQCREQVEAARVQRERSAAILAGAGPRAVQAPPFEVLAARAGVADGEGSTTEWAGRTGGREEGRKLGERRPRLVALAWAASVLMAVSAGWLAREMMTEEQIALEPEAEGMGARAALPPGAEPVSVIQEFEQPAAATGAAASATAEPGADAPAAGAAPSAANVEAVPPSDVARDEVIATGTAQRREAARTAAPAPAAAPPAPPPPPPPPVADRPVADRAAFSAPATRGWTPTTRENAESRLGRPLVALPDRPILRVEIRSSPGGPVIRIVQALEGGAEVVLEQSVATDAPAADPPASGLASARERRGDLVLTAYADLPADSLATLLRTAR